MSVGRAVRRLGVALAVVAVALSVFVGESGATGVAVSWSAPMEVAPHGGQGYVSSVSCPTASQCTAVDWSGQELTFDPQNPGTRTHHVIDAGTYGGQLVSVDCVSAQQCTAVDGGGTEVTFDPVSGSVVEAVVVAPITNFDSVSCPTATLCTAVGTREVAFNPLTGVVTPAGVTDFRSDYLAAVYCVSATQCTSVDQPGFARTFNPTTGQLNAAGIVRLNGGTMTSVTCPTATECVGGDGSGSEIPFNPVTGAPIGPGNQNWGMGLRTLSISCVSASSCTGVDFQGGTRTFDPTTGTLGASGETDLKSGPLQSVACRAAMGCVAVSSTGKEVTFDPATPASAVATGLDTAQGLRALACPSATQCTAVGGDASEVTFDPTTGNVVSSQGEAGLETRSFAVVACPSTTQCTAVLQPTNAIYDTLTFNPQTGAANDVGLWTSLAGAHAPSGLACPTVTQCTLVDSSGDEVTFDPTTGVRWGSVVSRYPQGGFQALACPTTTQCTAVNTGNQELTWNPLDGSFPIATAVSVTGNSDIPFTAVSCPSALQCTGVGSNGSEVTFNPTSGTAIDGGVHGVDNAYLSALSCPSTALCVAVDRNARSVSFDPAGNGAKNISPVSQAGALSGVACVSTDTCIAIDILGEAFSGATAPVLTPDTEITSWPDNLTWTTHATFVFSSHDDAATFECSLDGADLQPCTSPASYAGLSVGSHTFEVKALDGALSDPSPPTRGWTIRISDVGILSGPSDPSPSTSAAFSFSSDDSAATFQCSLDGAQWAACTSPKSYSNLDPGSHTFAVEAVNDGGVSNPTPVTSTWHVVPPKKLTLVKSGTGIGTVTSSPAGILCGSTCSYSFDLGASVTLTATPVKAAVFSGWSGGGCSGTGQCIVVMNDPASVTATFTHMCVVPSVTGKKLAGAKTAILAAACAVGTVTTKYSRLVHKGYVISQSPAAGKKLPDGTSVNLVVSLGRLS